MKYVPLAVLLFFPFSATFAQTASVRSLGLELGSLVFRDQFLSPVRYSARPVGVTYHKLRTLRTGALGSEYRLLYGPTSSRQTLRYDVIGYQSRIERLFALSHTDRHTAWWGPATAVGWLVRLRRSYQVGNGAGNNFVGGDLSLNFGLALRYDRTLRLGGRVAVLRGQAYLPLFEGVLAVGAVHSPQVFQPSAGEVLRSYSSVQPGWNRFQVQSRLSLDLGLHEVSTRRGPRTRGWRLSYAFIFQRFEKPVVVRLGSSLLGVARVF